MTTHKIEKKHWQDYFDGLSKQFSGRRIEIEVDNLQIGSQVVAKSILLTGIMFDSKDNALEIITPDLVHTIKDPGTIYVDVDEGILKHIAIKSDEASDEQIIKFIPPLSLTFIKQFT
ncbi:MAG: hypothetical protein ACI89W_000721 [Gammaproteobacteria bacterium]|jgi:hypothetical protein